MHRAEEPGTKAIGPEIGICVWADERVVFGAFRLSDLNWIQGVGPFAGAIRWVGQSN